MDQLTAALTHQPCPDCGSSDALTINTDDSTKCYACGVFRAGNGTPRTMENIINNNNNDFIDGEYSALESRGIDEATCRRFRYQVGHLNGKPCHIANYYDLPGQKIAQKYRFAGKDFRCAGKPDHFFGQHLWANPVPGFKLVVTEGEIDAMSVAVAQGGEFPVVSLGAGAQSAKSMFKKHFDWLSGFQEVILMFDMDESGRNAVEEVAHMLPAGKCKVAHLPHKDANECLIEGKKSAIIGAIFSAKVWRPDDILSGVELYEKIAEHHEVEALDYPFSGLNRITHGLRQSEIVTLCAGSGIGKSQVCRVITHHLMKTTDKRIGYIALEESVEKTALSIIGLEMGKCLHLEPFERDDAFKDAFDATVGSGRFYVYDHFGSLASDSLLNRIRFMIKTYDVDFVVLDHISIVVSGIGDGDERRLIDNTMTALRSLVEETKVALLLVSHLKRPEGRGHEEGRAVSLADLRGSQAIAQLSDMVLGLERSQQAEDPEDRNKTTVRVLKNRFSGETGVACSLAYDKDTARLTETHVMDTTNPF